MLAGIVRGICLQVVRCVTGLVLFLASVLQLVAVVVSVRHTVSIRCLLGIWRRYVPPAGSSRTTPTSDVQVQLTSYYGSSNLVSVSRYLQNGATTVDNTWRVASIPLTALLSGSGWNGNGLEALSFGLGLTDTLYVDAIQLSGGLQLAAASNAVLASGSAGTIPAGVVQLPSSLTLRAIVALPPGEPSDGNYTGDAVACGDYATCVSLRRSSSIGPYGNALVAVSEGVTASGTAPAGNVTAMWASSSGQVWAVGGSALVMTRVVTAGAPAVVTWSNVTSAVAAIGVPSTVTWFGVCGSSTGVVLVGSGGTIARWNATSNGWKVVSSPSGTSSSVSWRACVDGAPSVAC